MEKDMVDMNMKEKSKKEKWIKHYSSKQNILLVGEGDFSFAACLAVAFGNACNIVATCRDSEGKLGKKYAKAKSNLDILKKKGCVLLHQVDALTMTQHPVLLNLKFDRIVFNFPHTNLLLHEHDPIQIRQHQELVLGFMKSAKTLLAEKGEVHVTHKTAHPFDRWKIKELGSEAGLYMVDEVGFHRWHYPGYCNKKGEGHGSKCNQSFPVGACSTFMFAKLDL